MSVTFDKRLLMAVVVVALGVGGGGLAKLAGVPYVHASFAVLGLPAWFGYFIGAGEVLGAIGLFIQPLRLLAATGLFCIMAGASYFHIAHTPLQLGIPAFLFLILCAFIMRRSWQGAGQPQHV